MKKTLFCLIMLVTLQVFAFPPNPPPPRLAPCDYQTLMDLEVHGLTGIVWRDQCGRTHISTLPGYLLTFCAMTTGVVYAFPCCCDSNGCVVQFIKDPMGRIFLNGVQVYAYPLDYTAMHLYLLPA